MMQRFQPQKALHLYKEEEKKKPKLEGEYAIFQKYDGWYCYIQDGKVYSRAGRLIPSVKHLKIPKLPGILICELLVHGEPEFSVMNGILNRKAACNAAYFKAHDYITDDVNLDFGSRYSLLQLVISDSNLITIAPPLRYSRNPSVWKKTANAMWASGREGVILKRLNAPYSPGKRNSDLLKIKEEVTLDLLVTGLAMGKGKYQGTLGALLVTDKKGKEHAISGMSDSERTEWWNSPKKNHPILGKVVEVKAMKKLKDGSLREPRFKAIRFDKTKKDID